MASEATTNGRTPMSRNEPAVEPHRPLLVDAATAAELLSVGERKLWELTRLGDGGHPDGIRCIRIGRAVRYDPRDLSEWIDQQKHQ